MGFEREYKLCGKEAQFCAATIYQIDTIYQEIAASKHSRTDLIKESSQVQQPAPLGVHLMATRNADAVNPRQGPLSPGDRSMALGAQFISRDRSNTTTREEGIDAGDEPETKRAQQWSIDIAAPVSNEHGNSDTPGDVDILGVEHKVVSGQVRWSYLTKPPDMTVPLVYDLGLEPHNGYMRITKPLHGGYRYVQYVPKWVRCQAVALECRRELWKAIGEKFFRMARRADDEVKWDKRTWIFENRSQGWSAHLCCWEYCTECETTIAEFGNESAPQLAA